VRTSTEPYATKSDFAYRRVRELVLSGELPPGAVINQAALAQELGVSTTPLREALRRLKQQGLVELDAHRDARVTGLSAEEAQHLLEVRLSLDPLAAALAAERRTEQDVAGLQELREGLQALPTDPTAAQLDAHRRFHAAVYRASHNPLLVQMLDDLWDAADRYRRHGLEVERTAEERARTDHEHALLVRAVADGDARTAERVMRQHVERSSGAKSAWRLAEPGPAAEAR
jgi:DNA-binding GntR family transcriptional regulator